MPVAIASRHKRGVVLYAVRGALQPAFEFRAASGENRTGELLSMREPAFEWLASQSGPSFAIDSSRSEEHDCSDPR